MTAVTTTDRRWVQAPSPDPDSEFVGVVRGLDAVEAARSAKSAFREALSRTGAPADDEELRRWWPVAERPNAREAAQSILRG